MPRCHRYGNHNSGHINRHWPNYFSGYGRIRLIEHNPKTILYRSSNIDFPIRPKKELNPNLQSDQKKIDYIDLKIEDIRSKIKDEINSRKFTIRKHILKDDECLTYQEGNIYRLKTEFLEFLLERSKFRFLKKEKIKKDLENSKIYYQSGIRGCVFK